MTRASRTSTGIWIDGAVAAVAAVAALTSCGHHDRPAPAPASSPADDDDRATCDPRQAKQCVGADVVACEPDGKLGRRIRTCKAGCEAGACVGTCADDGNALIYAVDAQEDLLSFDPRKLPGDPFKVVGRLACGGAGSPFSMAVDRKGTAWVEYQAGDVYAVSILDASCRAMGLRVPRPSGMGFVSTAAGSDAETLYLASNDGAHTLVSLDPSTRATRSIGPLVAADGWSPELTGTSGARLFGFFTMTTEPSFVQEIDRATGAAKGPRWPLGNDAMAIDAWAFAQWGGVFYVFVTTLGESAVYAVDPKTSTARVVRSGLPFRITGAGVSTCAPERDGG